MAERTPPGSRTVRARGDVRGRPCRGATAGEREDSSWVDAKFCWSSPPWSRRWAPHWCSSMREGREDRAAEQFDTVDVLVVKTAIERGESVNSAYESGKIDIQRGAPGPGARRGHGDGSAFTDQFALTTIYPGEQLIPEKFGGADEVEAETTLPIPEGMIAISVSLSDTARVGIVHPAGREVAHLPDRHAAAGERADDQAADARRARARHRVDHRGGRHRPRARARHAAPRSCPTRCSRWRSPRSRPRRSCSPQGSASWRSRCSTRTATLKPGDGVHRRRPLRGVRRLDARPRRARPDPGRRRCSRRCPPAPTRSRRSTGCTRGSTSTTTSTSSCSVRRSTLDDVELVCARGPPDRAPHRQRACWSARPSTPRR